MLYTIKQSEQDFPEDGVFLPRALCAAALPEITARLEIYREELAEHEKGAFANMAKMYQAQIEMLEYLEEKMTIGMNCRKGERE